MSLTPKSPNPKLRIEQAKLADALCGAPDCAHEPTGSVYSRHWARLVGPDENFVGVSGRLSKLELLGCEHRTTPIM